MATNEMVLNQILDKLTDDELSVYIHHRNRFAYKAIMKAKSKLERL